MLSTRAEEQRRCIFSYLFVSPLISRPPRYPYDNFLSSATCTKIRWEWRVGILAWPFGRLGEREYQALL